jgi:hypothetical protein
MLTQHRHSQIKIVLAPEEHDRVRIAAALRRTSMAEFCRDLVLVEARRLAKNLGPTERAEATSALEEPQHGAGHQDYL